MNEVVCENLFTYLHICILGIISYPFIIIIIKSYCEEQPIQNE